MLRTSNQHSCSQVTLHPAHAPVAAGWAWSHPAARLLRRGAVLAAALFALFLLWPSTPAHAQTCTVTVTDTGDSGAGSLRAAIAQPLAGGTVCFDTTGTFSVPQTITLTSQLQITQSLTISGTGADNLIVSGGGVTRVFTVTSSVNVTMLGLGVRNGYVNNDNGGGGIYNNGALTLTASSLYNNKASSNVNIYGGGVYNNGALVVTSSRLYSNTVISGPSGWTAYGGGIYNSISGSLTLSASLYSNTAMGSTALGAGEGLGGGVSNDGVAVILAGSSIYNNTASSSGIGASTWGGGIFNTGALTLTGSIVYSNTATAPQTAWGGGIANYWGTLTVMGSSVYGNQAAGSSSDYGGGISTLGGKVTLAASSVYGNQSVYYGGGVSNYNGTFTLTASSLYSNTTNQGGAIYDYGLFHAANSTLWSNDASSQGGGIYHEGGTLTAVNLTLAENRSADTGGIYHAGGSIALTNTIVADSTNGDISGTVAISANNWVGPLTLGPLQDNGGATWTMALPVGSPAIDAGTNVGCPATDQRGVTRPQLSACDIGAYELRSAQLSSLAINPGALSPSFISATLIYTGGTVANVVSSVAVTAVAGSDSATVIVQVGSTVCSGAPVSCPLAVGANTISVTVTTPDGSSLVYTVTLTRLPSDNAASHIYLPFAAKATQVYAGNFAGNVTDPWTPPQTTTAPDGFSH